MSYNCSSGNFSSQSFGGYLRYPVSAYSSFYPSNVGYSPKAFQLGSSFYNGRQKSFYEPCEYQEPCVETRSLRSSCYRPKNFFSSPCQGNFAGSMGYSNYSGFGSCGFGHSGIQSSGYASSFYRPAYFSSKSVQSSYYQPACGSRFFGSTF